ncbi:MAG: aminotransferase class I/II-fold pyridoxal phosphate-dependent enzyme, partial [Halobacteriaceae archaeon]
IHEAFANRREIILERLQEIPNISVNTPYGAFYVFVDISSLMNDSYQFVEELIDEERVAGVPGDVFGEAGKGFVRFSYANNASTIRDAMDRLNRFVANID